MTDHLRRPFVLVHGGGHGGWCFQRLARELRTAGHDVFAPTLTGFGERSHLGTADLPFATFVTDLCNVLFYEDVRDAVLVGHSMGGVIVPRVAAAARDRVASVVWLAAPVLNDGETLLDAVPQTPAMARAVTIAADGTAVTDTSLIVDAVLSDGTAADRAWVAERHRPYPRAALIEPGRLTEFLGLGVPTGYVAATRDEAIPLPLAREFAARLPRTRYAQVEASHDLMISRPEETAAAVLGVS